MHRPVSGPRSAAGGRRHSTPDEVTRLLPAVVDGTRPFGAHLRMSWWKPLVLLAVLPVVLLGSQVLAWSAVGAIEGSDDAFSAEFTPLKALAANLAIGATGVVAVLLLVWMTRVPWRVLLSPQRRFDRRRLGYYSACAAVLVAAGLGTVAAVGPEATGWTGFGITDTTLALLAVTLLTIPIQATGEELMYRGVLFPATASWVRAVRPALAVGLVVSSLVFAALHGSADPWLAGYIALIALSTGLMSVISGGLEAPIAFHVVNNVLAGIANNVMAGGGTAAVDRSTETGGPPLLILGTVNVAMVVVVRWHERRRRSAPRSAR